MRNLYGQHMEFSKRKCNNWGKKQEKNKNFKVMKKTKIYLALRNIVMFVRIKSNRIKNGAIIQKKINIIKLNKRRMIKNQKNLEIFNNIGPQNKLKMVY